MCSRPKFVGALLYAGLKARRRAQFAAAVRVAADLDEDSLRLLLQFVPAWVKHSEYERAKCVPRAPCRSCRAHPAGALFETEQRSGGSHTCRP